ncbi:Pet127-domain-containing protein, partial [Aureobasidium melanogenum]
MPTWRTLGVRPLRPFFTTAPVCLPCRSRLFSTITSRPLRHSTRLLYAEANDHDSANTVPNKPVTPEDANQTESQHNPQDLWPFNNEDLKSPEKRENLEAQTSKHEAVDKNDEVEHSKQPEADPDSSSSFDSNLIRKTTPFNKHHRPNLTQPSEESYKTIEGDGKTIKEKDKTTEEDGKTTERDGATTPFQSLKQSSHDSPATAESKNTIIDFFKSTDPTATSSLYDGGAIQSLRDAMLSIKSDPISFPRRTLRRLRTRRKPRFVNSPAPQTPERIAKAEKKREADEKRAEKYFAEGTKTIEASSIELQRLDVDQPRVPRLHHGLDRVLFMQGVYQLQDRRSKVYNFDPYLQKIMPVTEFDYDALTAYKTSSQDNFLSEFAKKHGKKYVGSTSSMTSTLTHFHYLLSSWRKINTDMFSRDFPDTLQSFTALNRTPTSIFLRRKGDTYAVDADKEYDSANVLMLLGRSMEKLLTMPTDKFERYRKDKSSGVSEVEPNQPEAYHYSSLGDFLLRSQLDAQDDRLPGTGMFDLKTRAVLPIRMQSQDHEPMTGYEITQAQGQYESFEREYYDMMRSTALKYSLQARMGHMDGIFVAYHNVKRIFGFQYISLNELDRALHGTPDLTLGNLEFNLSISLLNEIFNKATEKFPDQSIRFTFETKAAETLPSMYIFAEPMGEEDIETIQNSQKEKIAEWERNLRDPASKLNKEQISELAEEDDNDNTKKFSDSESDLSHESAGGDVFETKQAPETPGAQSETITAQNSEVEKDPIVKEIEAISEMSESEPQAEAQPKAEEDKPLLGMVLTVRSKVNGVYVERPENLNKHHEWSIDYSLTEIKSGQAWKDYRAAQARRRKTYQKLNSRLDKSDPDSAEQSYNEHYINMLKELSEKGRKMRARLDQKAADKPKIVVGMPYAKPSKSQMANTDDVSIESVDDYLTWLYKEKA